MDRALIDFIDRLAVARTLAAARQETLRFFETIGYPDILFAYADDPRAYAPQLPGYLFSERLKKLWRERPLDRCFMLPDDVRSRIVNQTRPFIWTLDEVQVSSESWFSSPDEWVCGKGEHILSYFGVFSTFIVPIRAPSLHLPGAFIVTSQLRADEVAHQLAAHGHILWLAALASHEYMCQVRATEVGGTVRLSEREVECLEWLSRGLRNDRIAERMSIAVPTVDLHIANARRKLSAQTREQALVKAISLGLISPG